MEIRENFRIKLYFFLTGKNLRVVKQKTETEAKSKFWEKIQRCQMNAKQEKNSRNF